MPNDESTVLDDWANSIHAIVLTVAEKRNFYLGFSTPPPVAKLGGNCNNESKAGLFNWNVNNTSSNSNWNIGSHLACVSHS